MTKCRTNLVGVRLYYCDGGSEPKDVWVDMKKVQAISWCDGEVKEKGKGKIGNSTLPTDKDGPGKCPSIDVADDAAVCWWNGSEWVCGAEA